MGFGKQRNKIRLRVLQYNCEGHYGYGQGKAIKEFGEEYLKGRSACNDICPKQEECRQAHYSKMDKKYPKVTELVREAVVTAKRSNQPIVQTVVVFMRAAAKDNLDEALLIKEELQRMGVEDMTDHYIFGQLKNIEKGLNGKDMEDDG